MANEEHLALLKKGVTAWNRWRDENPNILPDLRKANLIGANLNGANLSAADLNRANLNGADLERAVLVETELSGADLTSCRILACPHGV